MPIQLRTGLPGAGKTLGAVEHMLELRQKSPDRPLYQHGITGLRDGLAVTLDADGVRNWKDLPAGSILFIDECQKLMPASRGGDTPEWIKALSEHRHLGLSFVIISQHPSLFSSYVRKLVDDHIHTVRVFGSTMVERWRWPECMADPTAKTARKDKESKTRHRFSQEAMDSYVSSEMHTIKRRVPRYIFVGAALLVCVPLLAWGAVKIMHRAGAAAGMPQVGPASSSSSFVASGSDGKRVLSKSEWIKQQLPRVAGIPWSAPIYDDQKVQTQPELYCASYGGDRGDQDCSCMTEQGTKAMVPDVMCRVFVKDGVYNPYRSPIASQGPRASLPPSGDRAQAGAVLPQASQQQLARSPVQASVSAASGEAGLPSGGIDQTYVPPQWQSPQSPNTWTPPHH